ncbi:hypothetical protein [Noviherbaspirillum sp.]|jgi:hypothetical protein|uniref:hypothetical protein n=1 Tax=Noviherbaspirillum sp. TaxID=1926288 RepID=UPI0025E25973|nr:hypothetical protein [Noviherbaspirillum sp.]
MPIQRSTAKRLVSDTEFKLINESFPPLVGELSDKALLQRKERARKARDRYHTMLERQRSKASSTTQRGTAPSANLKEAMSKEKIFEETLARFERRSAKAGSGAASQGTMSAKPAKSSGKTETPAQSTTTSTTKRATSDKAKAAAKSAGTTKGRVNRPAQSTIGKKTGTKGGAQGVSKASAKTANKAQAKSPTKSTKAGKGKGAVTKATPRGRHGALVTNTTLH